MRAIVLCKTVESFAIMDMLIFMYFQDTIMMALAGHILRESQSVLRGLQRKLGMACRGGLEWHSRIYMIMKSFLRGIRK